MNTSLTKILNGTKEEQRALFGFTIDDSTDAIIVKFNLWSRKNFPQYFDSEDASFHEEIDRETIETYKGNIVEFVNAAFRGASKTSRIKLFLAFAIANDESHHRKYIKVLCADKVNAVQIVTDVYNMLISVRDLYPEVFQKTVKKREETMGSFTTSTGIKVIADTVSTDQRGALQEASRPDFIIFEDFENRKVLRSATITRAIWDNMEEARTGLSIDGSCMYNCNYISEMGNVHKLISKKKEKKKVLIIPIIYDDGRLAWESRYPLEAVEYMRANDDDFEGERLCKPSAAADIMFDRERLDEMDILQPIKKSAEFKIYKEFDPSHRYGGGHDVAGGVGLDSSTSVYIDFDTFPAEVVATFASNTIQPEAFGAEIARQSDIFGGVIEGIENNKYDTVIAIAKQLKVKLYTRQKKETRIGYVPPLEYGWNTNSLTKPKMIFALMKAIADGLLLLNDEDLIAEIKSYSRNDLLDKEEDPRLATRHFDLVIAAAIAWQMKDYTKTPKLLQNNNQPKQRAPRGHRR